MSPFGPFYCVFRWDLSRFDYPGPKQSEDLRVKFASENEIGSAARVWYEGLGQEEGSPWTSYLKKWIPATAAKWFLAPRNDSARGCWSLRKERRLLESTG